jgi:hypothetical protein
MNASSPADFTCPCCGQAISFTFDPARLVDAIAIGPQQHLIARRLARSFGQFVPWQGVAAAMYADDPDGGSLNAQNICTIQISHLRKRLSPFGLAIESHQGRGYRMVRLPEASP